MVYIYIFFFYQTGAFLGAETKQPTVLYGFVYLKGIVGVHHAGYRGLTYSRMSEDDLYIYKPGASLALGLDPPNKVLHPKT